MASKPQGTDRMAKKLKTYQTSIGFFELAVAAPSMKAAAEAWGTGPDIFQRGFATQTEDPAIVEATLAKPGIVLRRPVGSSGEFSEKAALPKAPEGGRKPALRVVEGGAARKADRDAGEKARRETAAAREAAAAADREKQRREEERRKEEERRRLEAEQERARKLREKLIARANAELDEARARHGDRMASIASRRALLDKEEAAENERWHKARQRHEEALSQAG